jgi:hypothetical protein
MVCPDPPKPASYAGIYINRGRDRFCHEGPRTRIGEPMDATIACDTCGLVQRVEELRPRTAAVWLEWAPKIPIPPESP